MHARRPKSLKDEGLYEKLAIEWHAEPYRNVSLHCVAKALRQQSGLRGLLSYSIASCLNQLRGPDWEVWNEPLDTRLSALSGRSGRRTSCSSRSARELRHVATDEANRKHYREQWLKTIDELVMMDVPQVDSLVFDRDRWADVLERQPVVATAGTSGSAERIDSMIG